MTLLIEDPLIEQLIDSYRLADDIKHKYSEALRAIAHGHDTFDCGKWHVLCCDDGAVVVSRRDDD